MTSISLSFDTSLSNLNYENYQEIELPFSPYILQNVCEKKALTKLKYEKDKSWIFRFDYITTKYYLTIKNQDEYINHHVGYYCKRTNEVIEQTEIYSSLESYLIEMQKIYNFDLSLQIIC